MRLETLLSKRRAAATRGLPDAVDDPTQTHVEWSAVEEGFRLLERDLGKLQACYIHCYPGPISDVLLAIH
jgi:CDK inhibitor PHO81